MSSGPPEEARDRIFKFKGDAGELKDWLYNLTTVKNQLHDRNVLKILATREAELKDGWFLFPIFAFSFLLNFCFASDGIASWSGCSERKTCCVSKCY